MANRYIEGEEIELYVQILDVDGDLVTADSLKIVIKEDDDDKATAYTLAAGQITNSALTYYYRTSSLAAGDYTYEWVASGTVKGVSRGSFKVIDKLE